MTDNQLYNKARELHYTEWHEANKLASQCKNPAYKRLIMDIGISLYHREELSVNNL